MKKLLAFLLLALALPAFGQRVTLTVTVTNKAVTGDTLVVNGVTRYFTNAQGSVTFLTNLTSINATKTNVFKQIASYPLTALTLTDGGTNTGSASNQFRLSGTSISASLGGTWGYLTLSTQAGSSTFTMLYPVANVVGETNRTNQSSDIVAGLNTYATNLLATNAGVLGNYLTKGASTQQVVVAPVQFNGTLRAGGGVALTNGFTRSITNINPVTSNLVNYGNAIRSEGSGGNSLQVGSNATASGALSMAVGNGAVASAANATALGVGSTATNTDATAIGSAAIAGEYGVAAGSGALAIGTKATAIGWSANSPGNFATAIGNGSGANEDYAIAIGGGLVDAPNGIAIGNNAESGAGTIGSIAIGIGAFAGHSNSLALGPQDHAGNAVATTTTNQLRLGTANHTVSIPGQLLISGTQSNTTFTGTNLARGAWAYPRYDLNSLAAGVNVAIPVGTNRFVRVGSGPASAATIVGMVGGATSGGIDGQDVVLYNDTGYGLTFAVNSVDPVPANRINTPTATDVTIPDQGWAQFFYDGTDARWKLINAYSGTNLVATATNINVTINTNGTGVGSGLTVNFTTGVTGYVSGGIINLGVSAAGGGGGSLVTNANQFGASTTLTIKDGVLLTNSTHYGGITTDTLVTSPSYRSTLQDQERVLGTDASGYFVELSTPVSKVAYVDNVTSDIQAQLDAKATTNQLNGYVANNNGLATNLWLYGNNTNALRINSGVITSSLPAIDISQTWSNSGVTFTGLKLNVVNSNSASSSLLADLQVGSSSTFSIRRDGSLILANVLRLLIGNTCALMGQNGTTKSAEWNNTAFYASQKLGLGVLDDVFILRESAGTVQFGDDAATATAQTIKAHDGSGTDKAGADLSINGGQGTGSGVGGTLNFKTAPAGSTGSSLNSYVTRMSIDHTGKVTAPFLATSNLLYLPVALASPAATVTIDLAGGSMQYVTMTNDTTIALTNSAAGRNVSVFFVGPTNNQYKLIMPSSIRLYSGAVTNTITTNKSAVVSFTSFDGISTNLVTTVAIEP